MQSRHELGIVFRRYSMVIVENEDHSHRVLVVEDEPASRYSLTIALDRKEIATVVAEDGAEAIEWLKANDFCLIVLDLVMPKIDGYGVIRHVLENKPHIPIIVVTGLRPDELSGVDRRVVVNVLFKPFDPAELAERVLEICHPPSSEAK
jgi:CheY-like chemotaxis protein